MKRYVATVEILIESNCEPTDTISEILSENDLVLDWAYLKIGGKYMLPEARIIPINYKEGDLWNENS